MKFIKKIKKKEKKHRKNVSYKNKRRKKLLRRRSTDFINNFKQSIRNFLRLSDKNSDQKASNHKKFDRVILFIVIALSLFGWVMVYSASFYVASQRRNTLFYPFNPFHFFILQGIWLFFSTIVGFVVYKIDYKNYRTMVVPAYILVLILLIIVLFLPEINGANLWIRMGPIGIQPSEISKPILIIFLSGMLSKKWNSKAKDFKDQFKDYFQNKLLPFSLIVLPIISLVVIGKDLATAFIIAIIALSIFFFSSEKAIHHMTSLVIGVIGILISLLLVLTAEYRLDRVKTFINFLLTGKVSDPLNTGYQLRQILIAVGTGGLFGYGFGQSRQKYYYLQETAFTDTIFAVIAEEFGFLGGVLVIAAFFVLILRGLKIAQTVNNKFASLTVIGIVTWFSIQIIVHLGVNVGLIPLTGITLPFMSYGGSSLLTCIIGVSILLNISKDAKLE